MKVCNFCNKELDGRGFRLHTAACQKRNRKRQLHSPSSSTSPTISSKKQKVSPVLVGQQYESSSSDESYKPVDAITSSGSECDSGDSDDSDDDIDGNEIQALHSPQLSQSTVPTVDGSERRTNFKLNQRSIRYTTSQKKKSNTPTKAKQLVANGYRFRTKKKVEAGKKIRWICVRRDRYHCKGTAVTVDNR